MPIRYKDPRTGCEIITSNDGLVPKPRGYHDGSMFSKEGLGPDGKLREPVVEHVIIKKQKRGGPVITSNMLGPDRKLRIEKEETDEKFK